MDETEHLRRRLATLSALQLALDHGMEVADEIAYRQLADVPAALVDLLGIDLDGARAVLDVQLRRLARDERERLAVEIDQLRIELGVEPPRVEVERDPELVVRLLPDYFSCGVWEPTGEADLDALGVTSELAARIQGWNDTWEDGSWGDSDAALASFRTEGLVLAAALQAELGTRACVVFESRGFDRDA